MTIKSDSFNKNKTTIKKSDSVLSIMELILQCVLFESFILFPSSLFNSKNSTCIPVSSLIPYNLAGITFVLFLTMGIALECLVNPVLLKMFLRTL